MVPNQGTLREFTVCIETRPMLAIESYALDMFHEAIERDATFNDPVCCYDEATGGLSMLAQVDALATHLAVDRAVFGVTQALVAAGLTISLDVIEKITAEEYEDDPSALYDVEAALKLRD